VWSGSLKEKKKEKEMPGLIHKALGIISCICLDFKQQQASNLVLIIVLTVAINIKQ
jgi:hypothetical protein